MKFRPIGTVIVVRPELEATEMWIQEHQRRSGSAEVLKVGDEVTEVTPGDRVWFNRFSGSELSLEDDRYLLLHEHELYAVEPHGRSF